jgi:hypothetical protein
MAIASTVGKTFGTSGDDYTQIDFWFSAGTNYAARAGNIGVQSGAIALWGVQLEIGSVATPLEKPDPADDLAKCQRFYQIGTVQLYTYGAVAGAVVSAPASLPVSMRGNPTTSISVQSNSNGSGIAMNTQSPSGVMLYGTATAVGGVNVSANFTASADL